jgi:aminopeptidase-like protein
MFYPMSERGHGLGEQSDFCKSESSLEPQQRKRGLYRPIGEMRKAQKEVALLWVLNLSDGCHSLLDIAEWSAWNFKSSMPQRTYFTRGVF